VAGGVARLAVSCPVACGEVVDLGGGSSGVVLRYDRTGAQVGVLTRTQPKVGATAVLGTPLVIQDIPENSKSNDINFIAVGDLLQTSLETGRSQAGARGANVLRLPKMPSPNQRRLVNRSLPSGLAAVEALLPLAEGQRVGFVGPAGTGKTAAALMLLASQAPDTACIYVAQRPLAQLKAQIQSHLHGRNVTVIHADPYQDPLTARYLLPLCAVRVAETLGKTHRHVLLVLDDLVAFASASAELRVAPVSAPQAVAALLDLAGHTVAAADGDKGDRTLSVGAIFDLEPEEEATERSVRDFWRSAEGSLDVRLHFDARIAVDGFLPAIDVKQLQTGLVAPAYQPPLLQQLRSEMLRKLRLGFELNHRVEIQGQLGLHLEIDEQEELASLRTSSALLSHSTARTHAELAVILCAAIVFHFPAKRAGALGATPRAVAAFQQEIIRTIQEAHPSLWNMLCSLEDLNDSEAADAIQRVGELLLLHRCDFRLTRPEF
jgi:F0F1-type ATP synthase alpha subunit